MKKILYLLFIGSFISCSSVQNYTKNDLDLSYYQDKKLAFQLTSTGVQYVNMEGAYMGITEQPNFDETFAEAVDEMAKETNLNLRTDIYPNSNIDVKVLDATWKFGLSSAELTTKINFHTSFGNYESIGRFKNASGGSKTKSLKKSFKNAIYNFLLDYQKRK